MAAVDRQDNDAARDGAEDVAPARVGGLRRVGRWMVRLLAVGMLGIILLIVTPITNWLHGRLDRQMPLDRADYIICLGGRTSRVLEASKLLQEGWAPTLVVSNHDGASQYMRQVAIEWGAPAASVLVDDASTCTADHPGAIRRNCGVDPARDRCIIVTSYEHMARSEAVFRRAGYAHIVMREPRWERAERRPLGPTGRMFALPALAYEYAAQMWYWVRGAI